MSNFAYGNRAVGRRMIGPQSSMLITPQCNITTQYAVPADLFKRRKQAAHRPEAHLGVPSDAGDVTIRPDEMVFTYANTIGPGGPGTAFSGRGFASFTGMPIPPGITQEQFEDMFQFAGFAETHVFFEGDMTTNSGVTVRKRGSGSIPVNFGTDTFYPGDMIGYELPAIDRLRRLEQVKQRPSSRQGVPEPGKHIAIPRLVTYEDIVLWGQRVANELVEKNARSHSFHIPTHHRNSLLNARSRSHIDELAIQQKQFIAYVGYAAIMAAMQRGYVVPSWRAAKPGQRGLTFSPSARSVDADRLRQAISARQDPLVVVGASGARSTGGAPRGMALERPMDGSPGAPQNDANAHTVQVARAVQSDFAEFMAATLGLVEDQQRPHLWEDKALMQNLLSRALFASLKTARSYQARRPIVANDFVGDLTQKDRFGELMHTSTIAGQMWSVATRASEQSQRSNGRMYDLVLSRVIGTVSNTCQPGGIIHYAM